MSFVEIMFPSKSNGDPGQLEAMKKTETFKEEPLDENTSGHYLEEDKNSNHYCMQSVSIKPMELLTSENQKKKIPPWQTLSSDKNMIFFEERDEYNPEKLEPVVEELFFSEVKPNLSEIDSEICSVPQSVVGLEQKLVEKDGSGNEKGANEATIFPTENCIKEEPRIGEGSAEKANKQNCFIIKKAANGDNLFRPISNLNGEQFSCFMCPNCNVEHPTMAELETCSCIAVGKEYTGRKWTANLVRLFLSILIKYKDIFANSPMHRGNIYERTLNEMKMANESCRDWTVKFIKKKHNNLTVQYKKVKDANHSTGQSRQTWNFFDLMDELHQKSSSLPAPHLLSGSSLLSTGIALGDPIRSQCSSPLDSQILSKDSSPAPDDLPAIGEKRSLFAPLYPNKRQKVEDAIHDYTQEHKAYNAAMLTALAKNHSQLCKNHSELCKINTTLSELVSVFKSGGMRPI